MRDCESSGERKEEGSTLRVYESSSRACVLKCTSRFCGEVKGSEYMKMGTTTGIVMLQYS